MTFNQRPDRTSSPRSETKEDQRQPTSEKAPTNSDRLSIFSYFELAFDPKHPNRFSFTCSICHVRIRTDRHGHLFLSTLVSHIVNVHEIALRDLDESSLKFVGVKDPSIIYTAPKGTEFVL